jgi:hypothetical protein
MSSPRWIFSTAGSPAYYQEDNYIYATDGRCEFSVSDGWWFSIKDGKAAYYVADECVFFPNGKPAFHFGPERK